MTKGQLIKALQDSSFGDNAIVRVSHLFTNIDIVIRADSPMDIDPTNTITVYDENELDINVIVDDLDSVILQYKHL